MPTTLVRTMSRSRRVSLLAATGDYRSLSISFSSTSRRSLAWKSARDMAPRSPAARCRERRCRSPCPGRPPPACRGLFQLGLPDLLADLLVAVVYLHPEAVLGELGGHLVSVLRCPVGDGENLHLDRRQPHREGPGKVLGDDADEPLDGPSRARWIITGGASPRPLPHTPGRSALASGSPAG